MSAHNIIQFQSPSNIAIIKYWGKHGNQLPDTPSLSLTLKTAFTSTKMSYRPLARFSVEYYFEGIRNLLFEEKVVRFMIKMEEYMPFLTGYEFRFESENSFPHSVGIASSASSMSALAFCLVVFEEQVTGINWSQYEFLRRTSWLARQASGSACRSVYGGWVTWGKTSLVSGSSDEYASPVSSPVHETFNHLCDAVLIVSSNPKKLSSSLGHELMNFHPFAAGRRQQAEDNFRVLIDALQSGNFNRFATIAENEALTLHSLLMTSAPDGLLLKPGSLSIIQAIKEFREKNGANICFTLDAGPNVHLLYPMNERARVLPFITDVLLPFCENRQWIDDGI